MRCRQLEVGPMQNLAYVVGDEATGEGALVDPGFEAPRLLDAADELGLRITHVLVTHGHQDHVGAVEEVVAATGASVVAHPASPFGGVTQPVANGQGIRVGGLGVTALHTPGHCPDHLVYRAGRYLFTGDLLFVGECGRTDLPGGDPRAMWRSLFEVLGHLPRSLLVCPGHDYGDSPTSTLEREFTTNYTLEHRSIEEFVAFIAEP